MNLSLSFSAHCPRIVGQEMTCMVTDCDDPAVGHVTAIGGPLDGRLLMVVCSYHATPEGGPAVQRTLALHAARFLLDVTTLGPGLLGSPEVWHRDHWDPMPVHSHE